MASSALKPLAQPQHNTAVAVNRESIARNFGISTDSVAYAKVGQALDGIQVLYDPALERTYSLPAGIIAGSVITKYAAGQLTYVSGTNVVEVDLNALAVKRALWFILYGYDFGSGAVMQYENDVLEYFDNDLGAFVYYRWQGALPYTVTAGSKPTDDATKDNWVIVGTQAISSALSGSTGASQVGWGTSNVGAMLNDHLARIKTLEEYPERVEALEAFQTAAGLRMDNLETFEAAVKAKTGLSQIGRVESIAELRTLVGKDGDWVNVKSYVAGKHLGGGFFYWKPDTTTTDDGGTFFRAGTTGGWVRDLPSVDSLTINHFGAIPDGATDAIPAMQLMHAWSYAYAAASGGSATYGPGIVLGVGTYAVSSMNLGTTEITSFKIRGPECDYGVQVRCRIKPLSLTTTTPVFTFTARFMEVANINWFANNSTQPFLNNLVTRGAYVHVKCFVFSNNYGVVFQLLDTIDTKFNEIYSFTGYNSFLKVRWSNGNPGVWDHPTAIEISNFNFTGIAGSNPVIDAPRAGQSLMRNGWFTSNYMAMDVSQGGWLMDTVIQEAQTTANMGKYAKVIMIGCRWEQGAGWDWDATGYDSAWDDASVGGGGKIPNWVTNGYDQGRLNLDTAGITHKNGLAVGFMFSENRYLNTTSTEQWINVGQIALNTLGFVTKMRFLGTAGWDGVSGNLDRPGATAFGGGEAVLYIEAKITGAETTSVVESHWWGQDNSPISEIRVVHKWSYQTVYVKLKPYTRCVAEFMETNDVSRLTSGTPFYFTPSGATLTAAEMAAVANNYVVPKRWSVNGGDYASNGLAMDFDAGNLVMYQSNKVSAYGLDYAPVMHNGLQRYIPLAVDTVGMKIPFTSLATLATLSPSTYVAHQVLVSDAKGTYARGTTRPAYSDGYGWYYMDDNTAVTFS